MTTTRRDLCLPEDGEISCTGATVFKISLGTLRPEVFAAELMLLWGGQVEELSLRHPSSHIRVRLAMDPKVDRARAVVADQSLRLEISPKEIESWLWFFLTYYQNGVAEVDHFDVEATNASDSRPIDVMVNVPIFAPPMSGKEFRRRILDEPED